MTARVGLPATDYPSGRVSRAFYERLLDRSARAAGHRSRRDRQRPAALAATSPAATSSCRRNPTTRPAPTAWRLAGPGYFAALGIPLRGREFSMQDRADSTAGRDHQRRDRREVFSERGSDRAGDRDAQLRGDAAHHRRRRRRHQDVRPRRGCGHGVLRLGDAVCRLEPDEPGVAVRRRRPSTRSARRCAAIDPNVPISGRRLDGDTVRGFVGPAAIQPLRADGVRRASRWRWRRSDCSA